MAEHRQLVDGWSDDEGSDDETPCAFARWEADTLDELPYYVSPIDRKVALADAVARSLRDAHRRGVASDLRLLLSTYRPHFSNCTQSAVHPTILRWLLGLTACSFDEGVATQAFELLSLLLAKADDLSTASGWPQLSLIAEYVNLYGTTCKVATHTSELSMQRYRSQPLSGHPAATTATGASAASSSPARSPARKRRRRGEVEVPSVGDQVKVGFKLGGKGEEQFFDGDVAKTATEGSVPSGTAVFSCNGTTYAFGLE